MLRNADYAKEKFYTNINCSSIIESASFSPCGRYIVTVLSDYSTRIWSVESGKQVGEPMLHGAVKSASFSPCGKYILTVSWAEAHVWFAESGEPVGEPMRHNDYVYSFLTE